MLNNPGYGALDNLAIAAAVLVFILLLVKYTKGFLANISVLLGIVAGCGVAIAMGKMSFDKWPRRIGSMWSRPLPSACPRLMR